MTALWYFPAVGLVLCLMVMMIGRMLFSGGKHGPPLRPGWLCMVVGLRGHGKSLFVARLIAKRLAAGGVVVANFPVSVPPGSPGTFVRMTTWEDVILAPARATVVLDEAHEWAPAEAGQSLDPFAKWYNSQCRKLEHEVWVITQDETLVSSKVRHLVNEYVECTRVMRGRHRAAAFAPRTFRKAKAKCLWAWWYQPKGAATRVYDTNELVRPVVKEAMTKEQKVERINELIDEIYRRRGLRLSADDESGRAPASTEAAA